jgi:hypothetical protein
VCTRLIRKNTLDLVHVVLLITADHGMLTHISFKLCIRGRYSIIRLRYSASMARLCGSEKCVSCIVLIVLGVVMPSDEVHRSPKNACDALPAISDCFGPSLHYLIIYIEEALKECANYNSSQADKERRVEEYFVFGDSKRFMYKED